MADPKQDEKICPLLTIAEAMSAPRGAQHVRLHHCRLDCAFYNANTKRCSIVGIDESLRSIDNQLENLAASLSYRKGG